jgi:hypothetical protein
MTTTRRGNAMKMFHARRDVLASLSAAGAAGILRLALFDELKRGLKRELRA